MSALIDTATAVWTSNYAPVVDAGGPYAGTEGSTVTLSGAMATDGESDTLSYTWSYTAGTAPTGASCSFDNDQALHPTFTCNDNGFFIVTLSATDGHNPAVTDSSEVAVLNSTPEVGPITATPSPAAVNSPISASATFTDAGVNDAHTATWDWGDGTTSDGVVTETAGSGSVSGSHTYASDGNYIITLKLTDKDGSSGTSTYSSVNVNDANGDAVFGTGTLISAPGALKSDPRASGQASFTFFANQGTNASARAGYVDFEFGAGNLSFRLINFQSLVVDPSGNSAQITGTGTINGSGTYSIVLSLTSGKQNAVRIQITDSDNGGSEVYDSGELQSVPRSSISIVHLQ